MEIRPLASAAAPGPSCLQESRRSGRGPHRHTRCARSARGMPSPIVYRARFTARTGRNFLSFVVSPSKAAA